MSKVMTRLLPLLTAFVFFSSGTVRAQQPDRPPNLNLGDAVVTGFSGTLPPDPSKPHPPQKSAIDLTFINPDGPSARIVGLGQPGYVWDGRLLQAPKTFDVFARDVGQVFGVALDDQTPPNIYLAATSLFGLNIVSRGRDGTPERRKKGGPGAGWMKGQFGLELQGGPGSIYKVDGRTGVVSLFANVTLDGVPNPGPGLGNLAYDAAHKQLFVSDLYTGMIHRFDLDGKDLGPPYDHGVTARPSRGNVPAQAFNPRRRLNIATARFNSEDPDTWDYAPPPRRVWALAVHEGRLYYSAGNGAPKNGPQIWSVGIERDGSFAGDPRLEVNVADEPGPYAVSDIAFSQKGAMILAQRAAVTGAYDYFGLAARGEPRVLRYWLKDPNDPPSPGRWKPLPEEYAVGFAGDYRNTNGGVALGYGYDPNGMLSTQGCEFSLWTTGQNLRNNPALKRELDPGGPLVVHGLAGVPAGPVRNFNEPPWVGYYADYDDKFDDPRASGHMGSVRIYTQPCAAPTAYGGPGYAGSPPYIFVGVGSPPPPNACFTPTSLTLPPCSHPGQAVSLDLSTTSAAGADPNWTVTPGGPNAFHTSLGAWTALNPGNWVQPTQSATADSQAAAGTYKYTRLFNLPCAPDSYRNGSLKLTGHFAVDNNVPAPGVQLNGNPAVGATCGPNCFAAPAAGTPFTFANPAFFVQGINSLTVPVGNTSLFTGLSVVAQIEAVCGPDCVCGCPPGSKVNKDGQCLPTNPIDLKVDKENTPGGGGGTWFNVWVTNVGQPITFAAGDITIDEVVPAGMTVSGVTGTGWSCVPPTMVGPGTMHCTYNLAGSLGTNVALSDTMVVHYTTSGPGPFINCAIVGVGSNVGTDTNPKNDKACAEVTGTPGKPIDVGIEKTGATTPYCPAPNYGWTITVNNGPNPWPGTGNIVVMDTVPANMTFDPINSPPWSCLPLGPYAGGTTFTCTYNGPAPTANQVLPPIAITATATTGPPFPPYVNCASVAIPSGSGYVDTNPLNNNFCTPPVLKPAACNCPPPQVMNVDGICECPPPTVPGPIAGQCICPQGTHLVEGACVPIVICLPPQIMIPGVGCRCPDDEVLVNGKCVKHIICHAPLVPNAAGTECMCREGTVRRGKSCVEKLVCREPATLNKRGTACICPRGMQKKGNTCVEREQQHIRIPRGVIPQFGFPGGGGGGGGRGDHPSQPSGGGQGATPGKR